MSSRVITILFLFTPPIANGSFTAINVVGVAGIPSTVKSDCVDEPVTFPTTSAVKTASVPSVPGSKTFDTPSDAYILPWILSAISVPSIVTLWRPAISRFASATSVEPAVTVPEEPDTLNVPSAVTSNPFPTFTPPFVAAVAGGK